MGSSSFLLYCYNQLVSSGRNCVFKLRNFHFQRNKMMYFLDYYKGSYARYIYDSLK